MEEEKLAARIQVKDMPHALAKVTLHASNKRLRQRLQADVRLHAKVGEEMSTRGT